MTHQIWRRLIEFLTVIGFIIAFVSISNKNWQWFIGGVTAAGIVLIVIAECLFHKFVRICDEKEKKYDQLQKQYEELAVFNDPEMLEIYKEDERERLRIQRQGIESQQEDLASFSKQFLKDIQKDNDLLRKHLYE